LFLEDYKKMNKEIKNPCKKIADWLNKKINIPFLPEWMEGLIFNKLVTAIAKIIIETIKKNKK